MSKDTAPKPIKSTPAIFKVKYAFGDQFMDRNLVGKKIEI
jgi:hypothetical protein